MRVYLGPHIGFFGPYQLANLLKYVGVPETARDWIAEKLPIKPFEVIDGWRKRKVEIEIHDYDVWGMDHTLAMIVHPMLLRLKELKHGAPLVADEDVPDELKSTSASSKENEWDTDDNHFRRWDWVMDEMIFAFEQLAKDSWEEQFYSGVTDITFEEVGNGYVELKKGPANTFKVDREGLQKCQDRIDNGLRLFAKYYHGLWD